MPESEVSMLVFDWKAVGKSPSKLCLYQPQKYLYKRTNVTKLIGKREIYGPQKQLSSMRCRIALNTMLHPKIKNSLGTLDSYMKHALLMGLSTDSAYALCLIVPDFCSFDRFLVVATLTPTSLIPRFIVSVRERRPSDNFYASFSKDSSIISVIVSPKLSSADKLEPYFFDANVYLLNLKCTLSIELSATIRASCRWTKRKLDRVCLRSTDYGAVLNSGLSIIALIFLSSLPNTIDAPKTKVFRLKKGMGLGYERSFENFESSVVLYGARKLNSPSCPLSQEEGYSFELVLGKEPSDLLEKQVYFIISTTEISSFIKIGTNKLLRYFSFNVGQIKCVDYELDIVECTSDYWIYSLVTTLIEVKTSEKALTYVGVFAINVNAMTKASDVSVWRKLRAVDVGDVKGSAFPYKRDRWYPFGEKRAKSVEERLVSDECLSTGESASLLSSPFPGIELEKTAH